MSETWQQWLAYQRATSKIEIVPAPITRIAPWGIDPRGWYGRPDDTFFRYVGVIVHTAGREVEGWGQPLIMELGEGAVMIVVGSDEEVLLTFKAEPGNTDVQGMGYLAPTLQASWANMQKSHGGGSPTGAALAEDERVEWVRVAKDGGRFINSFNRLGVLHLSFEDNRDEISVASNQRWFTREELKEAMIAGACNAHLREALGLAFL